MSFNERSRLIDHYFNEDDDDDDDDEGYIQKCFTIIFFMIIFTIVMLIIITPHYDIDHNIPSGISDIPYEYKLSHKSHWYFGYLIENFPVEFDDDQAEYVILAEIVSISTSWTLGNYEVREHRKNLTSDGVMSVRTVDSTLSFWMNEVHISFRNNNTFNTSNLTDPINPLLCEYKITWSWVFNGYLHRMCAHANETEFTKISDVNGSTAWGLTFLSDDGEVYAYTSETQYWWNMNLRDVEVKPTAPFPPVIPAIYTAYYDTIQRNRESKNRRHYR